MTAIRVPAGPPTPPVLRVHGLTKMYGKTVGVEDLTFDVPKGQIFGLLGPNGAGKTTALRCILGLLRPSAGRIEVAGMDPTRQAPRIAARIGYLPGDFMPGRLTARNHLTYLANLRGGGRAETLAVRFGLDLDRPMHQLSRGNRQKVAIVQAFMHEPQLLLLDEPTSGLDPLMQQEFHRLLRERKAAGATVVLSSHILSEVDALCDRVAVLRAGRLVAVDDLAAFKAKAVRKATVEFRSPVPAHELAGLPGVISAVAADRGITCMVRGESGPFVAALAALGPRDVMIAEPTIEEAFLDLYREAP